ncbi:family 78 glycoside hydrolase catalytic domain [Rhodopirellula sp. SWK7]|uniref:family 78 glycoside hydrolase catalytic domain n=1 Tax=Rhodopirellula sp. SWK7 TaxID=595460 RepID=UPI0007C43D6E|nr:family 78 glycoside hydrolase catalytic domain [Rhodopirellula sp. SWK7]
MNTRPIFPVFLLLLNAVVAYSHGSNGGTLDDLRVEHLHDPIQLDTPRPRLSWKLLAEDSNERDLTQQSYQVLVASQRELLSRDQGDLWDSGMVQSSQSVLVPYDGEELRSRQVCYWKVRVADNRGRLSRWSEVATWRMALLHPADWSGSQWIGLKDDTRDSDLASRMNLSLNESLRSHPSPLLRKEVTLDKNIRNAMAYVSGVGYADFYLNGKKVGDHVLDPGQTNYEQHTLYVVHDVTDDLKTGTNVLGFWLGNGFYGQNIAFGKKFGYGKPSVRAKLFIEYTDGTTQEVITDESWKATVSPIVFDNVYWGESYDARRKITGWSEPGLDDSDWQTAIKVASPCRDDQLRPQLIPPIKEVERLSPVKIERVAPTTWLVDFGKNIAGWVELTVNQKAGDVIEVVPAEVLDKDTGRADQRTQGGGATGNQYRLFYVCNGRGEEKWSPRFTYSGFQYVELSGLDSPPDEDSISAVFVRSAIEKTGTFRCSEEMLNQQYAASLLSLEGNWHSLPEDCPHREKCGWLGDAHATADLSLFNYDIATFYQKFIRDIEDSLRSDARLERVRPGSTGVPTMVAPGKRANRIANIDWGVAYLILPWRLYVHTGDVEAFKTHFGHIQDFIAYFRTFKNQQGVIENGLGDWCPPHWDRRAAPEYMECHPHVSGTAFYYQSLQIASQMASILGDSEYSRQCIVEAEKVRTAFENVYLNPIKGSKLEHYGSQTATVMALKLGMVSPNQIDDCVKGLTFDIEELHGGHHACGIHGLRHLYTVLVDHGQDELAYQMLTDTTFPSPGYVLDCGLSTWPERRFEWKKERYRNSFNHPMNGGFAAFMHESLGGIRPQVSAPGYKHFRLQPYLTNHLEWVNASVDSPYGLVRSEWKNEADAFLWDIEIPVNTTATIWIPYSQGMKLIENGHPFSEDVVHVEKHGRQWIHCEVGSGNFRFRVQHHQESE